MIKRYMTLGAVLAVMMAYAGGCGPAVRDSGAAAAHGHEHESPGHAHDAGDAASSHGDGSAPENADRRERDHVHGAFRVSVEKQQEWGIESAPVTRSRVASRISLPGVLTLNDNRTAEVTAFVPGRAQTVTSDLGDRVRRGQVLLTINSPDYARTQADFLEARASLRFSLREFERAERLFREKAIEEKEFARREASKEKWAMTAGALEATLHSYGVSDAGIDELLMKCDTRDENGDLCRLTDPHLSILSPRSGTIIQRGVIVGQHIVPEKVLFTVSDLSVLWALLDAHEQDIPDIHPNSRVVIRSPLYPEQDFPGRITYIGDVVDENLRTLPIRVEVLNPDGRLKPNMYIEGILENPAEDGGPPAVPASAVQVLEGGKVVFISEGTDRFRVRHVQTGRLVGESVLILSGLEPGERIVTRGAFSLKAEMSKATFGHAHVH